jgi:hypothetical protein
MPHTLSREELACALEYWMSLPYGLQLEALVECAVSREWPVSDMVGEIRHWLTMISPRELVTHWGPSLFGVEPWVSERDGERMMDIVEFAWRLRNQAAG